MYDNEQPTDEVYRDVGIARVDGLKDEAKDIAEEKGLTGLVLVKIRATPLPGETSEEVAQATEEKLTHLCGHG